MPATALKNEYWPNNSFTDNNLKCSSSAVANFFTSWQQSYKRSQTVQTLASLAIGTLGGAIASYFNLPLAWLLGAMISTLLVSFSGGTLFVPIWLRSTMIAVLGVLIGAAFTPEIFADLSVWWLSVVVILLFVALVSTFTFIYLRYVAGFDVPTAFFSSPPGGMIEMAIIGQAFGGDVRLISLVHAIRVALVVGVVPFLVANMDGVDQVQAGFIGMVGPEPLLPLDGFILIFCGAIGWWLATYLRFPAPFLVGPILLSVIAHFAGLSRAAPPQEIVAAAQVIIGVSIGSRFSGLTMAGFGKVAVIAIGSAILMVAAAVFTGWSLAAAMGLNDVELILALAPGGVAEMSLVALSIGIGTAFISAMHIIRIAAIIAVMPFIFRFMNDSNGDGGDDP